MTNNILINKETRKVISKDEMFIGMEGENLQEVLVFNLDEQLEGTAIIEILFPDETTAFIEIDKTERGYELPVKSSLLTQSGLVKMQLRIIQAEQEIFKSDLIRFKVKESINATATIPEQYPTWIDNLETLKTNLEQAESERAEAETQRTETFSQMQKDVETAIGNIVDLQEEYNTNAQKKIEEFNQNVADKTDEFDTHVEDKIKEYDEHTEELENRIAELENENENIKNQIPVGQAEGENITLSDSADMEFKELRIGGNSWQETRSGKNKFNFNNIIHNNILTSVEGEEDNFTVKTSDNTAYGLMSWDIGIIDYNNIYIKFGSNRTQITKGQELGIVYVSPDGTYDSKVKIKTLTAPTTEYAIDVSEYQGQHLFIMFRSNLPGQFDDSQTITNLTVSTEEMTEYEEYGAMPSPEFPSPIRNVGDNVNEFDYTKMEQGGIDTTDGVTTSTSGYNVRSDFIPVKANTNYTFSYDLNGTDNHIVRILEYDENYNYINYTLSNNKLVTTFKTQLTTRYLRITIYYDRLITPTTYTDYFKNIKFEKGSKSPYSPYNCGNFNETVCNKNWLPNDIEWAYGYVTGTGGWQSDNSHKNAFSDYIKIKAGEYTVSYELATMIISICFYDNNKVFIERDQTSYASSTSKTFTVKEDGYIRISHYDNSGLQDITTINNEHNQIEEGPVATDYIPHQSQQFTFPLSEGQRMYKDSYLADDGVHHTRTQIELDGTENWVWEDTYLYCAVLDNIGSDVAISSQYVYRQYTGASYKLPTFDINPQFTKIRFHNPEITSLTAWKTYLAEQYTNGTPVKLQYKLENEVIEPYTAEQQLVYNEIKKAHSYKNVTVMFSTDETKPIIKVIYRKDLETMFNNINTAIVSLGGV